MVKGLFTAAAGMIQRLHEQEVTSNNMANVNSTAFKKDLAYHSDVINPDLALQLRNGKGDFIADKSYTVTDHLQGKIVPTGNPLDVALNGSGFFAVSTVDGEKYTRDGAFKLNEEGTLVTSAGYPILGDGGEISVDTINGSSISISETGEISVNGEAVDTLKVVDFEKPYALAKSGESLFTAKQGAVTIEPEMFSVKQGYTEGSNVNIVQNMVNMIDIQRGYESNSKTLTSIDQSIRKLVNDVGKV